MDEKYEHLIGKTVEYICMDGSSIELVVAGIDDAIGVSLSDPENPRQGYCYHGYLDPYWKEGDEEWPSQEETRCEVRGFAKMIEAGRVLEKDLQEMTPIRMGSYQENCGFNQ